MAKGGKVPKSGVKLQKLKEALIDGLSDAVVWTGTVGAGAAGGYLVEEHRKAVREHEKTMEEVEELKARIRREVERENEPALRKLRGYAEGGAADGGPTGLAGLRNLADWWNEFMLPGDVEDPKIQAARSAAKEDTKRFIGSAATNVYGVDDEGKVRLPFLHDPTKDKSEPPRPGIVDQTLALPDWFAQWGGGRGPQWSQDANTRTEQVLDELQRRLGYSEADEPLEYFVEAGGTMAGQPPVPAGSFKALKAPFAAAGKYARDVAGPVLGRIGQAASAIPRAGIEFFGPMIEPSAYNYLSGTAFGGALRTLTDQFAEPTLEDLIRDNGDVAAPDPNLEISSYTPEEISAARARLEELRRKIAEGEATENGMAKGGKVKLNLLQEAINLYSTLKKAPDTRTQGWVFDHIMKRLEQHSRETGKPIDDVFDEFELSKGNDEPFFGPREDPVKHAKGGKVPPKTGLMELRKMVEGLMSDNPNVEGTGKELVPTQEDKVQAFVESLNPVTPGTRKALEDRLLQPDNDVDKAYRAQQAKAEQESLLETPVSRRDVLKGMVSLASPVDISPMALLGPDLEALTKLDEAMVPEHGFPIKKVSLSPAKLAAFLTDAWGSVFQGSNEDAVLHEADRFDQLEGGEEIAAALRGWYRRMSEGPSYHDPNTPPEVVDASLEKLNEEMDLEGKFQDFARAKGLLPNEKEWSEHGDMSFAEPPRLGARSVIEEAIRDARSDWREGEGEEEAKSFEKLLDVLGPRADELFARAYMSEKVPPELDEAFKQAGLDIGSWDAIVDGMESIYGPYGHIQNWIDAPPELRDEFHELEQYTVEHPNWHETEEGRSKRDRMREIEDTIFPANDSYAYQVRDLKLDDENADAAKMINRSREKRGDYGDDDAE